MRARALPNSRGLLKMLDCHRGESPDRRGSGGSGRSSSGSADSFQVEKNISKAGVNILDDIVRARDSRATSGVCSCCSLPWSSPSSSAGHPSTPRGSATSTSSTPRSIAPSMSRNFFIRSSFHGQKVAKSSNLPNI